jgi:hypothetical protein
MKKAILNTLLILLLITFFILVLFEIIEPLMHKQKKGGHTENSS